MIHNERSIIRRARYITSVSAIYMLTLVFAWHAFSPLFIIPLQKAEALQNAPSIPPPTKVITGLPLRIVVPSQKLDLVIDKGVYDASTNSWTLSDYNAQFATITARANNYKGNTFIYGHNSTQVFDHLRFLNPGDNVLIYTDNNHIFEYRLKDSVNVSPDDTSVFTYHGPPILTLQTCSGNWNEWRRMYKFNLEKILQ